MINWGVLLIFNRRINSEAINFRSSTIVLLDKFRLVAILRPRCLTQALLAVLLIFMTDFVERIKKEMRHSTFLQ